MQPADSAPDENPHAKAREDADNLLDRLFECSVQEGRSSATRGLVHDFSNAMVGLCSLTEDLLTDMAEDDPRRYDMELIRESAFRAYGIIRTIADLNRKDAPEAGLLDIGSWMKASRNLLEASLPKGMPLELDLAEEEQLVEVVEGDLRDALMVLMAAMGQDAAPGSAISITSRKDRSSITITISGSLPTFARVGPSFEDVGVADLDSQHSNVAVSLKYMKAFAEKSGGAFDFEAGEHPQVRALLRLQEIS